MSCEHDCTRPPGFPKALFNRPGLDTIDYRIGDYNAMLAHMLARIDAAPELAAWTHRLPDDPGIALVEAAAVVGDILAQYQHVYANEAYLRTARWRESACELVRVLGYRLAPGLGGRGRFAIAVKGDRPLRIPAGFAITATLPGSAAPATFETTHAFDAVPALSKFHLYRPRHVPSVSNGMDTFQLDPGNDMALAKGDRLLVGTADGRTLSHTQLLIVDKVWEAFGIRHVKTRGRIASLFGRMPNSVFSTVTNAAAATPLLSASAPVLSASATLVATASPASPLLGSGLAFLPAFSGVLGAGLGLALLGSTASLRAYKLVASARHFGHNAPATRVAVDGQGRATEVAVPYVRRLDANQGDPAAPQLRPRQLPLEGEVPEFSAGSLVLVEANLSAQPGGTSARKRVLEREVSQIDRQSLAWGGMTGASTVLELGDDLATNEPGATLRYADIRGVTVHAVLGQGFGLRAASQSTGSGAGSTLDFFGSRADAQALAQRTLLVALPSGPLAVNVQQVDLAGGGPEPRFFRATLDRSLDLALFGHDAPGGGVSGGVGVDVYGNLAETTQGKTEAELPLGDGDSRAVFQTFPLPKTPLTYLLDTTTAPPLLPELRVWVGGVRWQRVESFFGRGPRDCVYIVREADDGKSFVQFGDGRTGARLSSGLRNVVARYRTGTGAHGLAKDPPAAAKRLPGVDTIWMLEPATGGAAAESASHARESAPASMQSLGRIVSLADCEAEALQMPGVLKARAAWTTLDGTPLVAMTVLTASTIPADAGAIDLALRRALAARGPARWPLLVRIGERRRIRVELAVAADANRRTAEVAEAIAIALGVADDDPADDADIGSRGLMHWRRRNFGEGVHGSQLIAAAQNVPGVRWVRLERMAPAGSSLRLAPRAISSLAAVSFPFLSPPSLSLSPASLTGFASAQPPSRRSLRASALQLLSLERSDLHIVFVTDNEEVIQ